MRNLFLTVFIKSGLIIVTKNPIKQLLLDPKFNYKFVLKRSSGKFDNLVLDRLKNCLKDSLNRQEKPLEKYILDNILNGTCLVVN